MPGRVGVRRQLVQCQQKLDRLRAQRCVPKALDEQGRLGPSVALDTWLLHVRFARSGEPALRVELVEEYHSYAAALARRMHRHGDALEDLVQVAMEALLVALDRFDPERGVPFTAFATPTIVGTLKRYFRDQGYALRVPRRVHEVAAPARRAADRLTVSLGRSPSMDEVAREVGVEVEVLLEAQVATDARALASLDAPIGEGLARGDLVGRLDPALAQAEHRVALSQALAELHERDRQVLELYFVHVQSQSEIARRFGVSQMQVSRWVAAGVRQLRSRIPKD